jgi:hypothetical protein
MHFAFNNSSFWIRFEAFNYFKHINYKIMKRLKGLFLLVLLCATSYVANASCNGNTYTVAGASRNALFAEAGGNCCAGDIFEIYDVISGETTVVTMLTSGPNATCN